MRILIITTTLGTRGGIQRVTTVKANQFAEIPGNEVAIAFSDRLGWPENAIHPLSPKVHVFDMESPFWDREPKRFDILWRFPAKALRLRRKIKEVIDEFKPDVVVSTGLFEKYIIPFVKIFNRKFITVREYHFSSDYRQLLQNARYGKTTWKPRLINFFENNIVSRLFDGNFLLTRQDKDEHFKNVSRFDFMWNPSSFEIIDKIDFEQKSKVVLAAGRLTDQKNFKELLKIWAMTDRADWRLRIIGDGEHKDALKTLAIELGIEDCVEIAGYTSAVKEEMKSASIFAGTSRFEGFMLVIVEAMSQGCVPVSFKTPYGPADIIEDGNSGFLTEMHDDRAFAKRLSELIAREDMRRRMAEAARNRAKAFDVETICQMWMDKYSALQQKR